ncbi:MAG: hypothetical protein KBT29_06235 [Prevotellaceae bacterium]|nr:hypothetical protein [Candidatus Minthosoma caballi]
MKRIHIIYIVLGTLLCCGCSEDDFVKNDSLTKEQKALLGTAVNFNPSMAEDYSETRASYDHNGGFNEGDIMQIYRQYWNSTTNEWEDQQAYRTYVRHVTYATGTTINLSTDWKVAYKDGSTGTSNVDRMKCDNWGTNNPTLVTQTKADSLTWENGSTVRFRAWSRSNVAGCLNSGSAGSYYPDFCIADWVTVSGPTLGIPLKLRHVCSRIGFSYLAGNQFAGGEICLDKEDYMWNDNADSHNNDEDDKLSEEEAEQVVAEVNAVFNRLCMPAGIDIETGTLKTMTNDLYTSLSNSSQFNIIEQKTTTDGIITYGIHTPEYIKNNVKHPKFSNVDGRLYMITIPYDMSNDPYTKGDVLILPPKTRFKIKIRDVNNGDKANTSGYEAKEHIFSLSDIKNSDGTTKYPDGLPMTPGKSYLFRVGYLYDQLKVTVIEEGISWSTADEEAGDANNQSVAEQNTSKYQWWQDGIKEAITHTKDSKDYNPIFKISTAEQFKEFIALVNGTAATKTSGLELAKRSQENEDYSGTEFNDYDYKNYWWYDVEKTRESLATEFGDTVWVSRAEAEAQGYIFYRHYYPQISDKHAYYIEDYVRGPFSFYDEQVNLHLVVQLENDIDLHDWQLESIGKASTTPFKGFFDGGTHTLSNVNMCKQYLFGYMEDGEIRDLKLTSTHNLALLNEGSTSSSARNMRIVGISLKADCTVSPIAQSLTGMSYVVGCIHEGNAAGAMIGTADNMTMYGCMHASANITGAALLGSYAGDNYFFDPQIGTLKWGRFMCNYYQKSPTQATKAVGDNADNYRPQEYIRGVRHGILRAKNDNMIGDDVPYNKLDAGQKEEFYGLAPWKAMNYAIYQYNQMSVATSSEYHSFPENHKCMMKYEVDSRGYWYIYPQLVEGTATNEGVKNILYLNN